MYCLYYNVRKIAAGNETHAIDQLFSVMADEKLNRSTRTVQAVAAAVLVAFTYGVKVNSPRVFADAYSVRAHFHSAPLLHVLLTTKTHTVHLIQVLANDENI